MKYSKVYFLGTADAKEQRRFRSILSTRENNYGFDRNGGIYKVVVGDHIAFRYEVLQEVDRGAFG
jgi:hypothetical protein